VVASIYSGAAISEALIKEARVRRGQASKKIHRGLTMRALVISVLVSAMVSGVAWAGPKDDYMRRKVSLSYRMEQMRTNRLEDIPVFKGSVKNRGDRELSLVEVTVHFLDNFGASKRQLIYYPVKYYRFIVSSSGTPLEPSGRIEFAYRCPDCSVKWFQNYRAEISDIEFTKSGFSLDQFYNPFLAIYDKLKKIKE
jgi:hypothetical protein